MAALALAAFCFATTESMPIGLLPLIADGLDVSPSAVGLLVTGYGLVVAIASVPLVWLTARVRRRQLLTVVMLVFIVMTFAAALAPGYPALMVARLVTALAQAVFWPIAMVAAADLLPPEHQGRAAAYVFAGGSLAIVLGVPLGTWLGVAAGWRIPFLGLGALCLLGLAAIASLIPDQEHGQKRVVRAYPSSREFWLLVITVTLAVGGAFTAYTYITEFLTTVSGFSTSALSPLLLAGGAADIVGLIVALALVDHRPQALLFGSIAALALALLGLFVAGSATVPAVILFVLLAASVPGIATATQAGVLRTSAGNTDIGSAWASAGFNVGIGGGALLGGVLLPVAGVRGTPLAGLALACAALVPLTVVRPPRPS